MANTNSWAWPNIFNVSQNKVSIVEDNESMTSRVRLLILSEPTSLYDNPQFGVGLKRHLFQYNTENQKAIIKDRIINSLRINEPCADADKTSFADGLLFTGGQNDHIYQDYNELKMTVGIVTNYQDTVQVDLNEISSQQNQSQ